ncbi:MAG: TIGR03013 family PEP-CTERM/XrtA system glycosyltransferase [Desulfobulbaceae bacterium]|nr:TIGR03013 family PEP-CTERM/XrtA system glycosyltransferase [Desulfobulbaceae bacterium]
MPYILKKYYPPRNVFFVLGESLLIFLSITLVYMAFRGTENFMEIITLYGVRALVVTIIFQSSFYFFDLYDLGGFLSFHDAAARILQSFGVGCIFLAFFYYIFPIYIIPNRIFWPGFLAVCTAVFLWRYLYNYVLNKKMFAQSVIILGTGKVANDIIREMERKRDSGYEIVHMIGEENTSFPLPKSIPVTTDIEQLPQLCRKYNVERIVVAMDDRRGKTPIQQLMECKFMGYPIEYGIKFYERLAGKILVERVNPDWIIYSSGFKKGRLLTFSKQIIDIFLALVGLILTLPVTVASALIIRLESPGPVFYLQERTGLHEKPFRLIKFRSMQSDAEKDGPVWAMKNDTRVTRFGRFMRKTRIDEIPQMLNVLLGDMSFVGPRPERPVFVEQLAQRIPYYSVRHNVKPGITGWAQICYPYGASEEDALRKLEYDLYYIKNMSLQMDFWVIFQTIKTVLFQKGAR